MVVGRFNIILKMVGDYMTKQEAAFDNKNANGPRRAVSSVHPLPVEQPNFKWRMRVDIREGLNFPMSNIDVQPSTYCELGWSLYENTMPDEHNKVLSVLVENNQFPDFN